MYVWEFVLTNLRSSFLLLIIIPTIHICTFFLSALSMPATTHPIALNLSS